MTEPKIAPPPSPLFQNLLRGPWVMEVRLEARDFLCFTTALKNTLCYSFTLKTTESKRENENWREKLVTWSSLLFPL